MKKFRNTLTAVTAAAALAFGAALSAPAAYAAPFAPVAASVSTAGPVVKMACRTEYRYQWWNAACWTFGYTTPSWCSYRVVTCS